MNKNGLKNNPNKDEISNAHASNNSSETIRETNEFNNIDDPRKKVRKSITTVANADLLNNLQQSIKALAIHDPFREARRMAESMQDPIREARRMAETMQGPIREARRMVETMQGPFCEARRIAETMQGPIRKARKTILKYHQITDAYKNIFTESTPVNTFEEAYQKVLSSFMAARSASGGDTIETAVYVVEQVNYETKTFPLSKLSIEFYFTLVLTLIFFLYSQNTSLQSEKRISELLNQTQTIIIERLNEIKETDIQGTYYVVERTVNLSTKPTPKKSEVLTKCYPNQRVRLIERKGKWVKVEYYNNILGIHENGWCLKKYLKLIKPR